MDLFYFSILRFALCFTLSAVISSELCIDLLGNTVKYNLNEQSINLLQLTNIDKKTTLFQYNTCFYSTIISGEFTKKLPFKT